MKRSGGSLRGEITGGEITGGSSPGGGKSPRPLISQFRIFFKIGLVTFSSNFHM